MSQGNGGYILGNKLYDLTKNSAMVVLPAVGALYFGLAQIWGLPKAEEVVGSITVLATFLGVIAKVAQASYNNSDAKYDGTINVTVNPDGTKTADLNLSNYENPGDVVQQDEALFKVARTVQ